MNRSQKIGILIISFSFLLSVYTLISADWNGADLSMKSSYLESFLNGTASLNLYSSSKEFMGWNQCLLCGSNLAIYYLMFPIKHVIFILLVLIIYGILLSTRVLTFPFKIM